MSRKVTVDNYSSDPLYPRIVRAVQSILARGKVVAPVDVLIKMGLLEEAKLKAWRLGKVPYLERVIDCNLTRLSRLLRILRFHAHDLKLVPSVTVYMKWGKGPKRRLRFTKSKRSSSRNCVSSRPSSAAPRPRARRKPPVGHESASSTS